MSSTTPSSEPAQSGEKPSADEIAADIEATRARLAESVDALSDKLDVKKQAKEKVHVATEDVRAKVAEAAGSAQQSVGAATDKAVAGSRTLVEKFLEASRPVQAAVVAVPLALVITLIIRRARS